MIYHQFQPIPKARDFSDTNRNKVYHCSILSFCCFQPDLTPNPSFYAKANFFNAMPLYLPWFNFSCLQSVLEIQWNLKQTLYFEIVFNKKSWVWVVWVPKSEYWR